MALGWLLFGKGARHLTAEMLYEEAPQAKVPLSLATVYNTLNQFTDPGLLRQVSVNGAKTYFDTNMTSHHHFYLEQDHELVDIRDPQLVLKMPDVPEGYEIARSIWSCGCARRPKLQISIRAKCCLLMVRSAAFCYASPQDERARAEQPLFYLLAGIDAPKALLLDPAVEAASDDPAPAAVHFLTCAATPSCRRAATRLTDRRLHKATQARPCSSWSTLLRRPDSSEW